MSGDYPLRGRYPCPGRLRARSAASATSRASALGTIDLRTALVKSCDTVFYKFAYEQWLRDGGNDPVAEPRDPMVRDGAGVRARRSRTGVDLPSERQRHHRRPRVHAGSAGRRRKENRCEGAANPALTEERRRAQPGVLRGRQPLPRRRRGQLRDRPGRHARHAAAARDRLRRASPTAASSSSRTSAGRCCRRTATRARGRAARCAATRAGRRPSCSTTCATRSPA